MVEIKTLSTIHGLEPLMELMRAKTELIRITTRYKEMEIRFNSAEEFIRYVKNNEIEKAKRFIKIYDDTIINNIDDLIETNDPELLNAFLKCGIELTKEQIDNINTKPTLKTVYDAHIKSQQPSAESTTSQQPTEQNSATQQ